MDLQKFVESVQSSSNTACLRAYGIANIFPVKICCLFYLARDDSPDVEGLAVILAFVRYLHDDELRKTFYTATKF
jgi:hypothetical protein